MPFYLIATLLEAFSAGGFSGQVVALAYDNASTEATIGDFSDAGGTCQGRMKCWVPTEMTVAKREHTEYASTIETTTINTR